MGQTVSQTVSVSPCEALQIVVGGGDGIAPEGSGGYKNCNAGNSSYGVADSFWGGGVAGADGGAGYNNSNGTGVGGTLGPAGPNGTVITTSASGSNGADGSITLIF